MAFTPHLRAQIQDPQAITSTLTTDYWHFQGVPGRHTIRFNADHTFTFGLLPADGRFVQSGSWGGTWKINTDSLVLTWDKGAPTQTYRLPISPQGTPGTDSTGKSFTLVRVASLPKGKPEPQKRKGPGKQSDAPTPDVEAAATPTPPILPQDQQAASAIVQAYHDSLVFVTGADAAGSGFIATMAGSNFLVTNAHVAAGIRDAQFKTLDGTTAQGGAPSIAIGEDIFCMAMPAGGKPLQVMRNVDQNAAIGDSVAVLGNAEGGGVINTIIGKIVGIGPNLVEVDAPFVPGNSGSPIIHLKSGKVIGVATYLVTQQYDLTTDKRLPRPIVRRFGYRLDGVKGWQAVQWPAFYAQATRMESIEKLTTDLADFFADIAENRGTVTMGRHTNPVIAGQIQQWIASKQPNESAQDRSDADANFLSFLKIACQSDITAAQSKITYDYFRRDLADQKQARNEMSKGFEELIQAVQQ